MNSRSISPSSPHPFCFCFFRADFLPAHFYIWLWSTSLLIAWCVGWTLQRLHKQSNSSRMAWQHVLLQEGLLSRPAQSQEHGDRKFLQESWTAPLKVLKPSAGSELAFDMDHVSRFNLSAPDRCERVWRCRGQRSKYQRKISKVILSLL